MNRKILIYAAMAFLAILLVVIVYVFFGDKENRHSDIRIENASLRAPLPGQTVGVSYFHIINTGGANELLSISTPVSPNVELHTVLQEDGIMKMRKRETVKIPALTTTKFERGGLHVMLFDAKVPENMSFVPLTFTFVRPPVPAKNKDAEKTYTLTVEARLEN
ncbi:MAG: copper chaperone PCu(A)C [Robiginitomaculum sp.]|nr:copper chaperone PCu(A)C [Robiginitomaculum sp.]